VLAFWAFVLVALILIVGVVLCEPYAAADAAERRLDFVRRGNQQHARTNDRLRAEIDAIQNDPFYAERVVRVDLSWQRPGERVVRLHATNSAPLPRAEPAVSAPAGWLARTADRLARNDSQRAFTLGTAALLLFVAFACFSDARRPAHAEAPAST